MQAVTKVTHLIGDGSFDRLRGLMSRKERDRLKRDVETGWDGFARDNIALGSEDVVSAFPTRVLQHTLVQQRFCDIDVAFVVMKMAADGMPAAMMNIQTTFHREYTDGKLPDWVITRFRVAVQEYNNRK